MCKIHAEGFQSDYPELCEIVPYDPETIKALTEEARAAGL